MYGFALFCLQTVYVVFGPAARHASLVLASYSVIYVLRKKKTK